jgi:hypothetical protein
MANLKSYNDLKIPDGLFPPFETYFLERIGLAALMSLRELELSELNDQLNGLDDFFLPIAECLDHPEVKEAWQIIQEKTRQHRRLSWDDLPKIENNSEFALIAGMLGKFSGLNDGSLSDTMRHLDEISEKFGGIESVMSVVSLKLYQHGIKVALEIEVSNDDLDIQHLRLGKSSKFFCGAQALQTFTQRFLSELNTARIANSVQKDKRVKNARKGGMKSHSRKKGIQNRCCDGFIIEKSKFPDLKKAAFVHQFIESLSDEDRREFAPTNIQRNLQDSIRLHEKSYTQSLKS